MTESIWLWVGFNVFVLAMLALDLGVFHPKTHECEPVFLAGQTEQHRATKSPHQFIRPF